MISHNHQLHFNVKSQSTSKYHANDGDDDDNEDGSKIILAVKIANNVQSKAKRWVTHKITSKKYAKQVHTTEWKVIW